LLERPHDYLGAYVSRGSGTGWNPAGLRVTPHLVVESQVRAAFRDLRCDGGDRRAVKVYDPSTGSGRTLLHASNRSMNLHGQDTDPLAVTMSRLNGVLYAPWLAFPLPEHVLGLSSESPAAAS
jgi:hypothetical protein